jgi:hypothetical protein
VVHPGFAAWPASFPATVGFDEYERHMKYVNHQADAIYLAGLPDNPENRPHSEVSERNGWKAPAFIRQN